MRKLFIFDMGGVVTGNVYCIPAIAAHLGIDEGAFFRGAGSDPDVRHTSPYNLGDVAEIMKGAISPETFWRRFNKRTGFRVSSDLWGAFFAPAPIADTYRVISDLRARGCRVVCGTNSLHAHYEIHRSRGEYDCFDAVYASHKMGVIKPDPSFWERILRAEQRGSADAFFVDDNEENTLAAAALGIRSFRFSGDGAALEAEVGRWLSESEVLR